ncbi:hypothetical protein FHQ18_11580 [Deferribacter autotrophicus]|uniref:Uncharacterized protein n=1 Tax=Deferribacter autotrophicus TaxID=500465 RepID=A0A5A8F6D8_9BACT|nr:hypothetical protein [Deferribacter autotrophicus]KAA0257198.1 hypothetical protein FHQ18_11580 [Deferribacter autotrophicus]
MDKKSYIFNVCISCKEPDLFALRKLNGHEYVIICSNISCPYEIKIRNTIMEEHEVDALQQYNLDVRVGI